MHKLTARLTALVLIAAGFLAFMALTWHTASAHPRPAADAPMQTITTPITSTLTNTVALPIIVGPPEPPKGLYGFVTRNGKPYAGAVIHLNFCRHYVYYGEKSIVCDDGLDIDTTTDPRGYYTFRDVPSLPTVYSGSVKPAQISLSWTNCSLVCSDQSMLASWKSREIFQYVQGSIVEAGTFDIVGIELIAPSEAQTVSVPFEFRWRARTLAPGSAPDNYAHCWVAWLSNGIYCSSDLGLRESYLSTTYQPYYRWWILVRDRTGGTGRSSSRTMNVVVPTPTPTTGGLTSSP